MKYALITGAGSGIGRACAKTLAQAQYALGLIDRDADALQATMEMIGPLTTQVNRFVVNVAEPGAIGTLYQQAPPTIDCLINCAGITRDNWLWKLSESNWDDVIDVNLKGTFLMMQGFVQHHLQHATEEGRDKSIINISSIVGKVGNQGQCNYAASKAGVVGLTKAAAKELAQFQIRVNAIQPGFIQTPMVDAVPEKVVAKMKQEIPLGRLGEASEIAQAIQFLANSEQSSYMTGNVVEVSGGLFM